jgi:hypothetical protein
MQKVPYIKDFSFNSADVSAAAWDPIASTIDYHSDILLFSRYKVLEPFAPYHLVKLRG